MMNSKIFLIIILGLLSFSTMGCDDEEIINESQLPLGIKTYLETHFPSCRIIKIVKDREDNELSYDIDLDCGVNIEFNGNSQVIDIDSTSKLPDSVIPENILNYVSINYPNDYIIGWELEGINQRVDMNTSIVLEFDSAGNFLRLVD